MNKLKKIPKFKNEDQERAFWSKYDSTDYLDWRQAKPAVFPNLRPSTCAISLRLPENLLNRIKTAAHLRAVPYQSLIKIILDQSLPKQATA